MIKFDLTEILNDSGLNVSFNEMYDLARTLSVRSSEYIENTKNLTVGLKPTEGLSISKLPISDPTMPFIKKIQTDLQSVYDMAIPEMYTTNAFQLLIASGVLPLGWLSSNKKHASTIYDALKMSWDRIVMDYVPLTNYEGPLYPHIKSFGLVARMIGGHKNSDLVFFAIYDNQIDYNFLQNYITKNCIDNIILMTESEYAEKLINGLYYTFLVKFDKFVDIYNGVSFKATTKLVESVPTYALKIGCNPSCVLFREVGSNETNPHFKTVEFKKGASVTTTVYVPGNFMISLVSLNGAAYFNGTIDMDAAGISISETDITTLTGYKTFNVTVSGLTNNTELYIEACEDMTNFQTTRSIISKKSTISVTDRDITFNLITTSPFIFVDTSKIKIWAKKDDEHGEELVTTASFLTSGRAYKERKAGFVNECHRSHPNRMKPSTYMSSYTRGRDDVMFSNNINNQRNSNCVVPYEPKPADNVMIYGVSECGIIIVTIDGYNDYKYFRIEFEDRAMIMSIKTGGFDGFIDIIPRINDITFTNEYYDSIIDDDAEDGVNNDEDADNNTKPDVMISDTLGLSYDK